jgi:CheY-like chemotaxis protein
VDLTDASGPKERRQTLRVLIVDDLAEIRFLLEIGLSREGKCRLVGQAENGAQALEKIEFLRPDIVIMDMEMPVMDGPAATEEIKARWPSIQVLGYTSSTRPEGHDLMMAAGATQSFNKGDLHQLLNCIRDMAAGR